MLDDGKKGRLALATVAWSVALAITSIASAQVEGEGGQPSEPPGVVMETPPPPGSYPTAITPRELMGADAPPRDFVRPRAGFSLLGGYTVSEPEGWMMGASARLGVQIGDWFSVYYQPTALYASLQTARDRQDGAFTFWSSFLVEATLADWVSVGVGPSVDIWTGCDEGVLADTQIDAPVGCTADEPFFGLHGRVALNIPTYASGDRNAIQVSFEVHPTWFGDGFETVAFLGGLGFDTM
ncbi:hypothetical protein [Sandaracinus amylolyticus]|uniref:Uncharacterized protein n=1 Tax=Sandaracinus amylolyticus TaxID=927083 RepID=A0A0F6YFD7_9BACT|nr:hypothetical protein [Sandaracinus amylolyticus]AKF03501.1 hypothetical protein DB32_000650 [Sandaracinus amylolyticus]